MRSIVCTARRPNMHEVVVFSLEQMRTQPILSVNSICCKPQTDSTKNGKEDDVLLSCYVNQNYASAHR